VTIFVLLNCTGNPYTPGSVVGVYRSQAAAEAYRDKLVAANNVRLPEGHPFPARTSDYEIDDYELED
jgi:hypothetical protein